MGALDMVRVVGTEIAAAEPPLLPPGRRLRFGIEAADGRRSIDWAIWAGRRLDDVYVAARDAGNWIKVSLHGSGSWSHGLTTEAWLDGGGDEGLETRHFEAWRRPAEIAPGVTLAMRIVIATSELRPGPTTLSTSKLPVYTIPPPDDGDAVAFEVYLVKGDAPTFRLDAAAPIGNLGLASGAESVWVVARAERLDGDLATLYGPHVQQAREEAAKQDPLPQGVHGRIAIHGFRDGNVLQLIEMAVDL
jgi:hypothetical protein